MWAMPLFVLVGFFIRLFFINNEGFQTDVSTYVAWALALSSHGFRRSIRRIGFADYPPGYFYILAVCRAFLARRIRHARPGLRRLRMLVKLPAVFADLAVGVLLYALVRRFAGMKWALGAAALYLFNPATIYISASWGQVDSIAGGMALLAIYLARFRRPAVDGAHRRRLARVRVLAADQTASRRLAAAIDRVRVRRPPNNAGNEFARRSSASWPPCCSRWCSRSRSIRAIRLPRSRGCSSNTRTVRTSIRTTSVNAFNLWAFRGSLWLPEHANDRCRYSAVRLGPRLGVGRAVLIVYRYVQQRTAQALLEASAIAAIAFFVLATRMHERYLFNGLLFTIACIPFARRYLWSALALTVVLYANLQYSLQYLHAVMGSTPGINSQILWGIWTHIFALAVMGIFFWLGYTFLGASEASLPRPSLPGAATEAEYADPAARHWFDPREGLTAMRAPLDYVIMGVLGLGNFIVSFIGYWYPSDKVFDEIYFARAGEEYLQNFRIYENTHPPLSKLIVTLSIALFGGMPHGHGVGGWTFLNGIIGHMHNGDNSYGWRFLDVVFGALVVMLLYVFAKRVTGSTVFATVTALLLSFDGMHFVQSRIATPEGFVVFFATLAVYAFYRFLISSQVGERQHVEVPAWEFRRASSWRCWQGKASLGFAVSFGISTREPRWSLDVTSPRASISWSATCSSHAISVTGDANCRLGKARTRYATIAGPWCTRRTAERSTRVAALRAARSRKPTAARWSTKTIR